MILAACRFGGIDPDQTFFIGDRDSDMKAAENAGCPGIRIRRDGDAGKDKICLTLITRFLQPCWMQF